MVQPALVRLGAIQYFPGKGVANMKSPYTGLKPNRFWRTGVSEAHPLTVTDLYRKKFPIAASDKVATAGGCFAQHVANYLRTNGFSVMDAEPSPPFLSPETAKA